MTVTHRLPFRRICASALAILAAGAVSSAHAQQAGHHADALGAVDFPVSCTAAVQKAFNRGVALIHHMMYVEARQAFDEVAKLDPACAMAHWGIAMTLFQPLWPTRPSPADLKRGWETVQAAQQLYPESDRERAYIAAVEAFFRNPESTDYWARIHRFEQAMEQVYRTYPDDRDAAAFYALSHLATAPQSDEPLAHSAKAAKILLKVYEAEPTHPGAVHYTIHANDIDGRASERLDVVQSYNDIAPSVPHALHMPTHIFVRLGDWEETIRWNAKSAEAALKFPAGDAISHHYPHALDYMIYAYLQRGEDMKAKQALHAAQEHGKYQQTFISAFHLAALPARYAVERRAWAEAAALPERHPSTVPWEQYPWPEGMTQFARGLGAVRTGDLQGARTAVNKLRALEDKASEAGERYFAQQIEIGRLAVQAWLARAEGEAGEAVQMMRQAAELEASTEKHPVTPGALQPAYELLGDLLLELNQPGEALEAYELSLAKWPRRFNSVLGAARAAVGSGEQLLAESYYSDLLELAGESKRPAIREAKAFLGTR